MPSTAPPEGWTPPSWVASWARDLAARGIDPRAQCASWNGHPHVQGRILAGDVTAWESMRSLSWVWVVTGTNRAGRSWARLACARCGQESVELREADGRRLAAVWGVIESRIATAALEVVCEVAGCTNLGGEVHHWLPGSVAGVAESERWPTSVLCVEHHRGVSGAHQLMSGYRWAGIDVIAARRALTAVA
jgi:hypothetical protein